MRDARRKTHDLEILLQVPSYPLQHRHARIRQIELAAGDLLVGADVDAGGLEHHLAGDFGDLVLVGVAAVDDPAADEILVEALRSLARFEPAPIAPRGPVAAAVRRIDLVGREDSA